LDDDFPDVPDQIIHTTARLREELVAAGILEKTNQESFRIQGSARKDQIWTAAAVHVIQKRRPNFMLLHMLITDSTQHKYGPQTPAAYTALALADAQLAEVLRAVEAAGVRERTTIFITADHGFETALKVVHPNVVLRKAGLLETAAAPGVLKARVQVVSTGGIGMVYCTEPATLKEDRARVFALLRTHEGVADIFPPEQFTGLHVPDPAKNRQMADLILVAKQGYAFSSEARGEEPVTEVVATGANLGYHGFLSSNPKMNAAFVAWGRGIKPGMRLGLLDNVDVAPTIARLLGQTFPGAEGRVLREMLSDETAGR
jgi:predicted AlkP superfamily pyrophosphatase or phosphodiesterase